jgi:hypothetical protein
MAGLIFSVDFTVGLQQDRREAWLSEVGHLPLIKTASTDHAQHLTSLQPSMDSLRNVQMVAISGL